MSNVAEIKAILLKEIKIEFRQRYAISAVLLYVVATVFVCYLSFRSIIDVPTWNALLWIIILFASFNTTAKSFWQETEGRTLYLYTLAHPRSIILAKMIYNAMLLTVVAFSCFALYTLFLGDSIIKNANISMFLTALFLGSIGLSSLLTMIAGIAFKTNNNMGLMAVLGFPIILPFMLTLIKFSKNALDQFSWEANGKYALILLAINLMVVVLSSILFPYLWRD